MRAAITPEKIKINRFITGGQNMRKIENRFPTTKPQNNKMKTKRFCVFMMFSILLYFNFLINYPKENFARSVPNKHFFKIGFLKFKIL